MDIQLQGWLEFECQSHQDPASFHLSCDSAVGWLHPRLPVGAADSSSLAWSSSSEGKMDWQPLFPMIPIQVQDSLQLDQIQSRAYPCTKMKNKSFAEHMVYVSAGGLSGWELGSRRYSDRVSRKASKNNPTVRGRMASSWTSNYILFRLLLPCRPQRRCGDVSTLGRKWTE